MKIKFVTILLAVLFITSCSSDKSYIVKVKLLKLTESTIYDKELVYDVLFDAEEANLDSLKAKSRKLFLKGIEQYKNKKNIEKAIVLFKKSILVFPDAKTYYELGNALYDSPAKYPNLEEAIKAYEVAEHLNFQPIANIYYKKACVTSQIIKSPFYNTDEYSKWDITYNLRQAFNYGFSDTVGLKSNPDISEFALTTDYKNLIAELYVNKENSDINSFFKLYTASFPQEVTKLEIAPENVAMEEYEESISYDYAQFIPEMGNVSFGRDVSHDFHYVAKVAETPAYIALVYSSINFYGETMQPVYTTLATYDKQGEIISKKLISCQCSADKIKTSTIENNNIIIKDYKRIWEQPIDKVPFEDNKVKNHELLTEAKFKIDDTGKIVDDEVPANYNDSTIVAKK